MVYHKFIFATILLFCGHIAMGQAKYPMQYEQQTGYHLYDSARNPTIKPDDAVITAMSQDDSQLKPLHYYVSTVVTPIETLIRKNMPKHATAIQKELNKELRDDQVRTILESTCGKSVTASFTVLDIIRRSRPELLNIPAEARLREMELWLKNPYLIIASINWKAPVYLTPEDQAELAKAKKKYEETKKIKIYGGSDPQEMYERRQKEIIRNAQERVPTHYIFIESGDDSVLTWEKRNLKTITGWIRRVGVFKQYNHKYRRPEYHIESEFVLVHTPNIAVVTAPASDDGAMKIGVSTNTPPETQPATQATTQSGALIMK